MRALLLTVLVMAVVSFAGPSLAQQGSGPQGDAWASIARLPDWSGAWIVPFDRFREESTRFRDPTHPDAPKWTPAYMPIVEANRRRVQTGQESSPGIAARQNAENCLPTGMPNAMRYPFAIEFIFTPGRVTILGELDSLVRRIYTDGRPHAHDPELSYAGESIGHWEGQTLVVHTTAISPNAELQAGLRGSGRAQITERIRLRDRTHLQIDTIVEDPMALTAPWRYTRDYERIPPRFFENRCQDNNRDVNGDEPDLTPPGSRP
jgi:hypothetical protein